MVTNSCVNVTGSLSEVVQVDLSMRIEASFALFHMKSMVHSE